MSTEQGMDALLQEMELRGIELEPDTAPAVAIRWWWVRS